MTGNINGKETFELFNNYVELLTLFKYLKTRFNIKICIVSFGYKPKIELILGKLFHDVISSDDIFGSDKIVECIGIDGGKNIPIRELYEKYNIKSNEVLFFDDLLNVVENSKKIGINSYNNNNSGINVELIINELNKY
jgi:FMN phosphatase YigB (HAD superfamily)